jgi:hypothetical protein
MGGAYEAREEGREQEAKEGQEVMEELCLLDLIATAVLFFWALVKLGDIAQNTDAMRRDISRLVRSVESRNGPATPTIHGEEEGRPARKIYEGRSR